MWRNNSSSKLAEVEVSVVSARGLAMPLENRGLRGLEVSVLFQKQHYRSDGVLCTTTDRVCLESEFSISKHKLIVGQSIMVYRAWRPREPCGRSNGINGGCRTLISCAAIDPRLACV